MGKSTAVKYLQKYCASKNMNCAVVAPTGIAALNAGGQTIHSFFKIPTDVPLYSDSVKPKKRDIIKNLDLLIIDEISMVRADMFDFINKVMQFNRNSISPFGGVRVAVVGDLFQLPPVLKSEDEPGFCRRYKTRFFIGADCFQQFKCDEIKMISLTKTFRQKDEKFFRLLNDIREGKRLNAGLRELNRFCKKPPPDGDVPALVPRTCQAEKINSDKLAELDGVPRIYPGKLNSEKQQGDDKLPAPMRLELKVGAKIIIVKNDPSGRWVNG
ncbi:MAG: AAA family ATPase, partial [Betaproteobacteria bacterium]|nr:AAA family ATPase [Betaproteobacteria bacterium]